MRGRGAFTLIELLVSITVLVLLLVFLGQMLNQTSTIWLHGTSDSQKAQNARAMTDAIAVELQTALLPVNRTSKISLQFLVNPPQLPSTTYLNPCSFFWQAPVASDQSCGDVAEVGYFVRWDTTTNPNIPKALLCRFCVNPGNNATPDPNFLIYNGTQPNSWLADVYLANVAKAAAVSPAPYAPADSVDSYRGLFADDVVGLWVRCLDNYGQPITMEFASNTSYPGFVVGASDSTRYNSRLGFTDSQGKLSPSYIDTNGKSQPLCALPPIVEVSMAMLDSNTAARVTPALQGKIVALINQITASSASARAQDFVNQAQTPSNGLQAIANGLRSYETKVYLQNSN